MQWNRSSNSMFFFIDFLDYLNDRSTKSEFDQIYEFINQFEPVLTKNFVPVRPKYKSVEEKKNIIQSLKWNTYKTDNCESFKIIKYTCWNDEIRYSLLETFDSFQVINNGYISYIPTHF